MRFLVVEEDPAFFHFQLVAFVGADDPLVEVIIFRGECKGCAFLRDPDRAVVIPCPGVEAVIGEDLA